MCAYLLTLFKKAKEETFYFALRMFHILFIFKCILSIEELQITMGERRLDEKNMRNGNVTKVF